MPNPFRSPNLWVKATAISAAALTVSLGLCGLNYSAFVLFHLDFSGPSRGASRDTAGLVLTMASFAEAAAILFFTAALLLSLLALLINAIVRHLRKP